MSAQSAPFDIHIMPRTRMTWERFLHITPPNSIALDGAVMSGPRCDDKTHHLNFDHHDCVVRDATMSTAMQVYFAIKGDLMDRLPQGKRWSVYINDTDQDTAFAVWLLLNYKLFEGVQTIPHVSRLLGITDKWDITGGAFPMNLADKLVREHAWVFQPYSDLRKSGRLATADECVMRDNLDAVLSRLDQFMMGQSGTKALDTRHEILYDSPAFKVVDEIGGNEARYLLFSEGMKAFISIVARRPDGRLVCSIGRKSQHVRFPVSQLYLDFNALEGEGVSPLNGWGGSGIVGGSSRESGTGLSWEQLRDATNRRLRMDGIIS